MSIIILIFIEFVFFNAWMIVLFHLRLKKTNIVIDIKMSSHVWHLLNDEVLFSWLQTMTIAISSIQATVMIVTKREVLQKNFMNFAIKGGGGSSASKLFLDHKNRCFFGPKTLFYALL